MFFFIKWGDIADLKAVAMLEFSVISRGINEKYTRSMRNC